jgi:hypothetical protein
MITPDLIEYIKSQINKNISKDLIVSRLLQAGWYQEDIDEGFLGIKPIVEEVKQPIVIPVEVDTPVDVKEVNLIKEEPIEVIEKPIITEEVKNVVDPYRELPDGTEPVVEKTVAKSPAPASSLDMLKIWVPTAVKPKTIEALKDIKPASSIALQSEPVTPKEAEIEYISNESEKSVISSSSVVNQTNFEPNKIEVGKDEPKNESAPIIELNKLNLNKIEVSKPEEVKVSEFSAPSNILSPSNVSSTVMDKPEEKLIANSFIPIINKNQFSNPVPQIISETQKIPTIKSSISKVGMSDILPRNAMISSYSQDLMSSNKEKEEAVPQTHKNSFFKFIIILFVVSLISGMIFAFVEGYLKIPGSNLSFSVVKKDPKTIIMNAPTSISKLKSYKVETNINISSPSLSNISIGLSSGKAVNSEDRDSVSIMAKGVASHESGKLLFDYDVDFNSSILTSDIVSNWKFDGTDLSVSIPNLSQVFKKDAPLPTTVTMKPNDIGSIVDVLSPSLQNIFKKIDIYNILSNDVPLYVKNETTLILKEFIGSLNYNEKGEDVIHGVETYHYEMSADRQSTKKLLSSLTDLFIMELPADQKKNLEEAIGASTFSSFDVWVGKNDNNIYQLKFTLNAPLSTVLGLNDSGIAGNEVKLDLTTTYYDLDVENKIVMPDKQINMEGYIKNIRDIKIKNIISSFKPQANSLRNSIGSYGGRSNPAGSCTNPNPGSLFSPQGHPRSAEGAISSISSSMISLLSETNGAGSCYSTPDAWALSAPLATSSDSLVPSSADVNYFYCTDSRGVTTTLSSPITGAFCK